MDYVDELRAVVTAGNAVFVLGTGASKALSKNAPQADWVGLLRDGIARARGLTSDDNWERYASGSLEYALTAGNTAALITTASVVQQKFLEIGEQAYANWLRESVGSLEVKDPALADALVATGCPLFTTNYDELLEKATGRATALWQRAESVRDALKNDPPAIAHLHGHWREKESVVLSTADYQRVLGDAPAQHLQASFYAAKTFIFVGYGSGLKDPNFGWMLQTHRKLFPESRHHHYQLVAAKQLSGTRAELADSNIRIVSYGTEYSDLPDFIRTLAPKLGGGSTRQDYVSFAREALVDQVRDETVLGDLNTTDVADTPIEELVVAPILLPMPHEKFAASQEGDVADRPQVLDPRDIYGQKKIFVVAGEEGGGVTTALRWLAVRASETQLGTAPLYVDARQCRGNTHALDKEVRHQALTQRLIDQRRQDLPGHILAVDNLAPASTNAFRSLIDDLSESDASSIFIGVRLGTEAELVELLRGATLPVEVVYLGKPGRSQVQALAYLIAPDHPARLVEQVLHVLRREHLQRTPFNICLLLMLLSRGAGSMTNASDTAVLDKYIQLLTGRGGNFLDPRWTLDPQNRESVLSDLARRMVRDRRGSMSRVEVAAHFDAFFASVDWREDSYETLNSLVKMRVLRSHNDSVSFQQSSYLHLFAAKSAIGDPSFLSEVLEDPLYFAPIIRHYAALVRNSEQVASRLLTALMDEWPSSEPTGPVYAPIKLGVAPAIEKTAPERADAEPNPPGDKPADEHSELESYDWSDDRDAKPFPLDDPRDWPLSAQLSWALDLASRVVRDSDGIQNLNLKDELFSTVLDRWGYLLDIMSSDPALRDLAHSIMHSLEDDDEEEANDTGDKKEGGPERVSLEERLDNMMKELPPFLVFAGINATLASRKLLAPLDRADASKLKYPVYFDTASAMLALSINVPGWATRLPALAREHGSSTVVAEFLLPIVIMAYRYQTMSQEDEKAVVAFLKIELGNLHDWKSKQQQDMWVADRLQEVRRLRELGRSHRLPEGQTAIETLDEDLK